MRKIELFGLDSINHGNMKTKFPHEMKDIQQFLTKDAHSIMKNYPVLKLFNLDRGTGTRNLVGMKIIFPLSSTLLTYWTGMGWYDGLVWALINHSKQNKMMYVSCKVCRKGSLYDTPKSSLKHVNVSCLGCQSELSAACIVICKLICKVDHL
jgi:hypothetical protein